MADFHRFEEILNEAGYKKITGYRLARWDIHPKGSPEHVASMKAAKRRLQGKRRPQVGEYEPKSPQCPKCGSKMEIDFGAKDAFSDPHGLLGPVYACGGCGHKGHLVSRY